MKVIYPDRTSVVYTPEETAGYESERLLNGHPKRYWKATSEDASVFQYVSPMGDAAALSYTNATSLIFLTYNDGTGTDFVTNGGFETAGAGGADVFASWTETASDGAIADEGSLVHAGSHAAKLTAGASVDTTISQEITSGFTVENKFKIAMYTRGDGTYAGRYQLEYYDGSYHDLIATVSTNITSSTYTYVANSAYIPAGTTKLRLTLYCPGTNAGIAYFDAVTAFEHSQKITYDLTGIDDLREWMLGEATDRPVNVWVDYTRITNEHTIEWEFDGSAGVSTYCGVVRAGLAFVFNNPSYGLREDRIDRSNTIRSYGGALLTNYDKEKHMVRQFSGEFYVERERGFYEFASTIAGESGPKPVMFLLTDENYNDWCVFGGFASGLPSGSHVTLDDTRISFTIMEEN